MPTRVEAATVTLGGAPAEIDWSAESPQLGLALALGDALLGLVIELCGIRSGHAALRLAANDHDPTEGPDRQFESSPGPISRLGLAATPLT